MRIVNKESATFAPSILRENVIKNLKESKIIK